MYPNQPYYPNQYQQLYQQFQQPQQTVLPPQQILTAKGKSSIDTIKMSPNSSVLIADETEPIIWKCSSDSLGNVTSEAWDISPHKDKTQKQQEDIEALVLNMNNRLKVLEENYEQSIAQSDNGNTKQSYSKSGNNQKDMGNAQKRGKSSSNDAENA